MLDPEDIETLNLQNLETEKTGETIHKQSRSRDQLKVGHCYNIYNDRPYTFLCDSYDSLFSFQNASIFTLYYTSAYRCVKLKIQ